MTRARLVVLLLLGAVSVFSRAAIAQTVVRAPTARRSTDVPYPEGARGPDRSFHGHCDLNGASRRW